MTTTAETHSVVSRMDLIQFQEVKGLMLEISTRQY